jgi:hypothetical protein
MPWSAIARHGFANSSDVSFGASRLLKVTSTSCGFRPTASHARRKASSLCRTVSPPSGISNRLHASA